MSKIHHFIFIIFSFNLINKEFYQQSSSSNIKAQLKILLNNEDIKNTWQSHILQGCLSKKNAQQLNCERKQYGYEYLDVEYFNEKPLVLKISKLVDSKYLQEIENHFQQSSHTESQKVEGYVYSKGYQGRKADGLWLEHNEPIIRKLYERMQTTLRINPAIAEEFLILHYDKLGHYAIHYDHLDPMPPEYDEGWFAYYGNRLATALLIVKTATEGGSTIFPRLNLNIQPEPGDLIFWFNADSNDKRELDSLHAACPIIDGTKMAISLWIRGNFQHHLVCSKMHAGYEANNLFRNKYDINEPKISISYLTRPKIPQWIFQQ